MKKSNLKSFKGKSITRSAMRKVRGGNGGPQSSEICG